MQTLTKFAAMAAFCVFFSFTIFSQSNDATSDVIDSLLTELEKGNPVSGSVIVLGDINFETGKSELTSNASGYIQKIARFLILVPTLDARIEGHADSTGSFAVNTKLSFERAKSVKTSFTNLGVEESRLLIKAHGSERPKASNKTEEGRKANRRVEIALNKRVTKSTAREKDKVVYEQNIIRLKDGSKIGASFVNVDGETVYYRGYTSEELKNIALSLVSSVTYTTGRVSTYDGEKLDVSAQSAEPVQYGEKGTVAFYGLAGYRTLNTQAGFYSIKYTSKNQHDYEDVLQFEGSEGGNSFNAGFEFGNDDLFFQIGYCGVEGAATMRGLYGGFGWVFGGERFQFKPGLMYSGQYARIKMKDFKMPTGDQLNINDSEFIESNIDVSISNRTFSLMPVAIMDVRVYGPWYIRASFALNMPVTNNYVIEFSGNTRAEDTFEREIVSISSLDTFTIDNDDYTNRKFELGGINGIIELGVVLQFE